MRDLKKADKACFTNGMTAKPCKHPKLDNKLHCKTCGVLVDIREKKNKYGNRRTTIDGKTFDSAKEAKHYTDLLVQFHYGKISNLEIQPRFKLEVNGQLICTYVADFEYIDLVTLKAVVQDVKPRGQKFKATPAYRMFVIKKNLMRALKNIDVQEV